MVVSKRCRPLLGTFVEVSIEGQSEAQNSAAMAAAFEVLERVASLMSFHDSDSELSCLNRSAIGRWVRVGPEMMEVLSLALELQGASHGAFNVAIGKPLIQWSLLPGRRSSYDWSELRSPGFELRGMQARRIARVKLDLGGIAKGYAVDRAVQSLNRADSGVRSGLVNAGGDLRGFGPVEHLVHLRAGAHGDRVSAAPLRLRNQALATSTVKPVNSQSPYVQIGRRAPLRKSRTTVVRAEQCMVADALTKIALFLPKERAEALACRYSAEVSWTS